MRKLPGICKKFEQIRKKQVGRSLQLWVADSRGCSQPDMFQIF